MPATVGGTNEAPASQTRHLQAPRRRRHRPHRLHRYHHHHRNPRRSTTTPTANSAALRLTGRRRGRVQLGGVVMRGVEPVSGAVSNITRGWLTNPGCPRIGPGDMIVAGGVGVAGPGRLRRCGAEDPGAATVAGSTPATSRARVGGSLGERRPGTNHSPNCAALRLTCFLVVVLVCVGAVGSGVGGQQ